MTPYNSSNIETKPWTRVSLSVFSATLTPTEITDILGQTPSSTHLKGDLVSPRHPEGKKWESHQWSITFDTDPELPFEEHIAGMIDFVSEKQEQFKLFQDRCDTMRIFCSSSVLHRCAFSLSVEDLTLLARTKVWLCFDLTADGVA